MLEPRRLPSGRNESDMSACRCRFASDPRSDKRLIANARGRSRATHRAAYDCGFSNPFFEAFFEAFFFENQEIKGRGQRG